MTATFDQLLDEIESWLRKGEGKRAYRALLRVRVSRKMTRGQRLRLAKAARQAGLYNLTLRILNPLVRTHGGSKSLATPIEEAEYAGGLIRVGAVAEGLKLLAAIPGDDFPVALLYQTHGMFAQWRYAEAIPLLSKYVEKGTSDYDKLVGRLNLASALVHEFHHDAASAMLEQLEDETAKLGLTLVHGNVLLRTAENAIHEKRWGKAETYLARASEATGKSGGINRFFVDKWKLLSRYLKDPKTYRSELTKLQRLAIATGQWETVRECDFYGAVAGQNTELFLRVYFGTPFESYRKRILNQFKKTVPLPESFELAFPPVIASAKAFPFLYGDKTLKVGQLLHRTFGILVSDFYSPFSMGALFFGLYPDEFFHPVHSPQRVYQAVKGVRRYLTSRKLPFHIVEAEGRYSFKGSPGKKLTVPSPEWWKQSLAGRLVLLKDISRGQAFTPQEAAKWLDIPRRTASLWLNEAADEGTLAREASKRPTRFRFP